MISRRGVFVFVGLDPNTGFLHGAVDLRDGFIVTVRHARDQPSRRIPPRAMPGWARPSSSSPRPAKVRRRP
jgi:hypothetical protein